MGPPQTSTRSTQGHIPVQEVFSQQSSSQSTSPTKSRAANGQRTSPVTETRQRGEKQEQSRDSERGMSRSESRNEKDRERSKRQLGEWTLGKTLGAGSMGKVKLGVSTITGEKVRRYCSECHRWEKLTSDVVFAVCHQNHSSFHLNRCSASASS